MAYEREDEPAKPIKFSEAQGLFLAAKAAKGLPTAEPVDRASAPPLGSHQGCQGTADG